MKTRKEKLFKIHEIKETPFNIIEMEDKYKIVIGNEIVSEEYNNLEEAKKEIDEKPWWLLVATSYIIGQKINKFKNEMQEIENQTQNN